MNRLLLVSMIIFWVLACQAQKVIKYENLKYKGYSYQATLNSSFVNKPIVFLQGADSVAFNVKIPFDIKAGKIYDLGIFYDCTLKKDSLYSF